MNKTKILIVDDEPDILEFLSYNFRKKGITICTANNGFEGIEQIETEKPDLIISDILMPEMDGIQMCNYIRSKSVSNQTPVLFLTALRDDYKFIQAMTSGGDQYISKPIRFEYLYALALDLLKKNHD